MSVDLVGMGLQYIPPKERYVHIQKQAEKLNGNFDFRKLTLLNCLPCDKALIRLEDMIRYPSQGTFIFYAPCGMLNTFYCDEPELIQLHNLIYFKQERLPKIVTVGELSDFCFRGI